MTTLQYNILLDLFDIAIREGIVTKEQLVAIAELHDKGVIPIDVGVKIVLGGVVESLIIIE